MGIKFLKDTNGETAKFYTGTNQTTKNFFLKDSLGGVVTITGWTIKCEIKYDLNDTSSITADFPLTAIIVDGTTGEYQFDFTAVDFPAQDNDIILIIYREVGGEQVLLAQYRAMQISSGITGS